ncbi:MAG: zeta toxin family protein [Succinivibrio sp.]|nr:zeta toxin family protein [Succinivibrio sp.]
MSALIKFISSIEKRYKTQHDNSPTLIIFAGTNGAGKSTLYESSEHYTDDVYIINPDVIAKKFACEEGFQSISKVPLNRQNVLYIKAGKEALKAREKAFRQKLSFGIETTASSDAVLKLADKAHNLNYKVVLIYVMLSDADLHIKRVANRVKNGGHFVRDDDIKRRFIKGRIILPELLKRSDTAYIYDNTQKYQTVLIKENGKFSIFPSSCNTVNETVKEAVIKIGE